jgi:hypothetical protein
MNNVSGVNSSSNDVSFEQSGGAAGAAVSKQNADQHQAGTGTDTAERDISSSTTTTRTPARKLGDGHASVDDDDGEDASSLVDFKLSPDDHKQLRGIASDLTMLSSMLNEHLEPSKLSPLASEKLQNIQRNRASASASASASTSAGRSVGGTSSSAGESESSRPAPLRPPPNYDAAHQIAQMSAAIEGLFATLSKATSSSTATSEGVGVVTAPPARRSPPPTVVRSNAQNTAGSSPPMPPRERATIAGLPTSALKLPSATVGSASRAVRWSSDAAPQGLEQNEGRTVASSSSSSSSFAAPSTPAQSSVVAPPPAPTAPSSAPTNAKAEDYATDDISEVAARIHRRMQAGITPSAAVRSAVSSAVASAESASKSSFTYPAAASGGIEEEPLSGLARASRSSTPGGLGSEDVRLADQQWLQGLQFPPVTSKDDFKTLVKQRTETMLRVLSQAGDARTLNDAKRWLPEGGGIDFSSRGKVVVEGGGERRGQETPFTSSRPNVIGSAGRNSGGSAAAGMSRAAASAAKTREPPRTASRKDEHSDDDDDDDVRVGATAAQALLFSQSAKMRVPDLEPDTY